MGPIQELYKLCLYYCQCVDLFYFMYVRTTFVWLVGEWGIYYTDVGISYYILVPTRFESLHQRYLKPVNTT